MVNEAQAVRERMLSDLARKRQTGEPRWSSSRGRDRLLESLTIAQQSLDAAVKDLVDSVPEDACGGTRRLADRKRAHADSGDHGGRDRGGPVGWASAGRRDRCPGSAGDLDDEPDPAFVTAEMEALTHVDEALEPSTEAESAAGEGADVDDDERADEEHVDPSGPDDPLPAEATESESSEPKADNPERPGMRSMICSLACVATATTTLKPSPSRSPRPSRKPSPRPTRTRRCEYEPSVSRRGPSRRSWSKSRAPFSTVSGGAARMPSPSSWLMPTPTLPVRVGDRRSVRRDH